MPQRRPWWGRSTVSILALAVFAGVVLFQLHLHDHRDFEIYYFTARLHRLGLPDGREAMLAAAHRAGLHPYNAYAGGPVPLISLVFEPLSVLSYDVALRCWAALSALVLVLGVRRAAPSHWPIWVGGLALMGGLRVGLAEAQPSVMISGLLLYALGCLRDREDRAGGAGLGLAVALKIYPAFLGAVFLPRHRSRQVLIWACVVAAVVAAIGIAAYRFSALHEGMDLMRGAARQGLDETNPHIQSLPGVMFRATGSRTVALFVYLAGTVGAVAWLASTRADLERVLGAACCLMLVTQVLSWEHYFVILLFPFMVLTTHASSRWAWALGAVAFVCLMRANPFPHLRTTGWPALLNAPSLLGALLLLVALAVGSPPAGESLTLARFARFTQLARDRKNL